MYTHIYIYTCVCAGVITHPICDMTCSYFLHCVAVCYSVLQSVCCSMLQCVFCSVLQFVAVCGRGGGGKGSV